MTDVGVVEGKQTMAREAALGQVAVNGSVNKKGSKVYLPSYRCLAG
jgi:hypothetical protein